MKFSMMAERRGSRDLLGDLQIPNDCNSRVVLHKDQILGHGAYGVVCVAEYGGERCVAKIMHENLFDLTAMREMRPERRHRSPYIRFIQECEFLSTIRHQNVIRYLCTYQDPESGGRPVLLMEIMEENLTRYLEGLSNRGDTVPYCVQVDISNDIANALVYLHGQSIVHRDLSGNNVLLSRTSGNITAKVTDFGMAARLNDAGLGSAFVRHLNSLTVCPGANVYMPPEALDTNPDYTNKIDCFSFGVLVVQILTQLFPQPGNRHRRVSPMLDQRIPEVERRQNHIRLIDRVHPLLRVALDCLMDEQRERPSAHQLTETMTIIRQSPAYTESRQDAPWSNTQARPRPERVRQGTNQVRRERDVNESRGQVEQCYGVEERDEPVLRLTWRSSIPAPCRLYRWCDAVVSGPLVYFRQGGKGNLHINHCYNTVSRDWNQLPRCPLGHPTLVIIDGKLTAIGNNNPLSNELVTLQEPSRDGGRAQWTSVYPPMPTKRYLTTALCTETSLIVAGGVGEGNRLLTTVEIMERENHIWYTAANLPLPLTRCSISLCDDHVYVLGGLTYRMSSPTTLTCSLSRLLESCHNTSRIRSNVAWETLADCPVCDSTCVSLCGHLLAIGGRDSVTDRVTSVVYLYKPSTNNWEDIGHMTTPRFKCFAAVLQDMRVIVVGGAVRNIPNFMCTNEVEFATTTFE